jgi:hypothetical protein
MRHLSGKETGQDDKDAGPDCSLTVDAKFGAIVAMLFRPACIVRTLGAEIHEKSQFIGKLRNIRHHCSIPACG